MRMTVFHARPSVLRVQNVMRRNPYEDSLTRVEIMKLFNLIHSPIFTYIMFFISSSMLFMLQSNGAGVMFS